MAIYYGLVFGLLVTEMVFFTILSLPFPRKIRRTILTTVSKPFQNEQFQIGLKFVFGFVLILFIDSVNRVMSIAQELQAVGSNPQNPQAMAAGLLSDRSEVQARKFYAQRNMYLCGFTLFLTLIITRTYSLVAELTQTKDKLDTLKTTSTTETVEVADLKEELKQKDEDLEILKSQAKTLGKDYDDVSVTPGSDLRARKV